MTSSIATPVAFSGAIPGNYDQFLGPMFFEPFALALAERTIKNNPFKVLELACGTGRLTRHLVEGLSTRARIYASDINPAMVRHGKTLVNSNKLHWMEIDAVSLPFPDQSFDKVVVQFGVMFYSDRIAAFKEARRVLKTGGSLLFSTWDHLQHNPMANLTNKTLETFFPESTPAFYQVPFSYSDTTQIENELKSAGFSNLRIETLKLQGLCQGAKDAVRGLIEGTPTITAIEAISPDASQRFMQHLEKEIRQQFGEGPFFVPLQAHVVTCS